MARKNVAEILTNHVTLELQAIDRMVLNAYVPSLQTGGGFVYFVKSQLGARVPSTTPTKPPGFQRNAIFAGHSVSRLPVVRYRDHREDFGCGQLLGAAGTAATSNRIGTMQSYFSSKA